VIYTMFETGFD